MKPAVQKVDSNEAQQIVGMVMALEAVEASVTDSDLAEVEKRDCVNYLRQQLSLRLSSFVAANQSGRVN